MQVLDAKQDRLPWDCREFIKAGMKALMRRGGGAEAGCRIPQCHIKQSRAIPRAIGSQ